MVLILTNDDVQDLITMDDIISSLISMYEEMGEGEAISRPRTDVHAPADTGPDEYYRFKTYGGLIPGEGVYALRVNSDILHWIERDGDILQEKLPRAENESYVGFVMLFDANSGTPLAVIHDGYIQKSRVGATSAIGAKYLANEGSRTFGLLGSGWQASGQLEAMSVLFDLSDVLVYSPNERNRTSFADQANDQYEFTVRSVDEPQAVFEADIVHSATNSRSSVYDVEWLTEGTHLGSINSLEIDQRALELSSVVIVHTKIGKGENFYNSLVNVDDIPYLESNKRTFEQFADLSDLVLDDRLGRGSADDVTFFFNNQGLGTQFASVCSVIYRNALDAGVGQSIPTEYFTQKLVP